jgi:hypothetical protein
MTGLLCDECGLLTSRLCPTCNKIPLCDPCVTDVGECSMCAPEFEDGDDADEDDAENDTDDDDEDE